VKTKQTILLLFGVFFTACQPTTRVLKGWDSGGGGVFPSGVANPWFLRSTPEVRYCIELDHENFGVTLEEARRQIEAAFVFWKTQIMTYFDSVPADKEWLTSIGWGIQDFVEVACDPSVELRFQLGVLDSDQNAQLKNLDQKLALSFRTQYELESMTGKGFIYLRPETGASAISRPDWVRSPWKSQGGLRLLWVLVHELGHVFGLPHMEETELMSEFFVDTIVRTGSLLPNGESGRNALNVFMPAWPYSEGAVLNDCFDGSSSEMPVLHRFLGVHPSTACLQWRVSRTAIELFEKGSPTDFDSPKHLGTIALDWRKMSLQKVRQLKIYLPKEQRVFAAAEMQKGYIDGPSLAQWAVAARYYPREAQESKMMQVHRDYSPLTGARFGSLRFAGEFQGQWVNDLRNETLSAAFIE
jgi:hypothetical protein